MVVHASVTVVDVPALVDAARAGWWLDVQLWDRSETTPRLLCALKVQAKGLDDESLRFQAHEVVSSLVRWLDLDVDDVQWLGNIVAPTTAAVLSSAMLRGGI